MRAMLVLVVVVLLALPEGAAGKGLPLYDYSSPRVWGDTWRQGAHGWEAATSANFRYRRGDGRCPRWKKQRPHSVVICRDPRVQSAAVTSFGPQGRIRIRVNDAAALADGPLAMLNTACHELGHVLRLGQHYRLGSPSCRLDVGVRDGEAFLATPGDWDVRDWQVQRAKERKRRHR